MTDPEKLAALAERCEALSGPDREVDFDIWQIANPQHSNEIFWGQRACVSRDFTNEKKDAIARARSIVHAPAYTDSLDAAMTLVPEHEIDFQRRQRRSYAAASFTPVNGFEQRGEGWAATPALALCAAALRALAKESDNANG